MVFLSLLFVTQRSAVRGLAKYLIYFQVISNKSNPRETDKEGEDMQKRPAGVPYAAVKALRDVFARAGPPEIP